MIWCPTTNGWKLLIKGAKGASVSHVYADEHGKSLVVPDGLSAAEHLAAKQYAYKRALNAWNALDKGSRTCICTISPSKTDPREVPLTNSTMSPSSVSSPGESTLSASLSSTSSQTAVVAVDSPSGSSCFLGSDREEEEEEEDN